MQTERIKTMLIDFHTHTFPDKIAASALEQLGTRAGISPHTDGTYQGLRDAMARDGVDVSVVLPVATNPAQVEKINRRALQTNETASDTGIYSFGAMHPDYPDYKQELRWLADNGFKGIKLHSDYQLHFADDDATMHIIDEAESLGLYTTLHAGIDIGYPSPVHCTPQMSRRIIDTLHPTHLILAHTGGWKQWDDVIELLDNPDVYFDISFSLGVITQEQFLRILTQHGSDHLLFGTDSPWDSAAHTLDELKRMPLSQDQMDDICYKNGARILGIYLKKA